MAKKKFNMYQKLLLDRKKELLRQALEGDKDIEGLRGERLSDPLDIAGTATALELKTSLGNNERRELEEIDYALQKIKDGSYGQCEECEGPIVAVRLEAIPTARLCKDCKEKEERSPQRGFLEVRKARSLRDEDFQALDQEGDDN